MRVTGFSFIRNAIRYDYPIVEAIRSILPLCDDFIVAVGNSDDETLSLINGIDPTKIKVVQTIWDDSLREGGRVLAVETDKALQAIPNESDWAFYIQGDEVVHEKYLDTIYNAMLEHKNNPLVEGLLFKYLHFYGSYNYIGTANKWYRQEIRVIRNDKSIYSFRDAQGFRKHPNEKLQVKAIDAYIYHYGWVKEPKAMQGKVENFNRYWHDDQWLEKTIVKRENFDYSQIDSLAPFTETHPKVMMPRIEQKNWDFDYDMSFNNLSWKDILKQKIEQWSGYRIGEYKNYRLIK